MPDLLTSETVVEVTYSDEILPGVALQPDIQYIVNPAADPTVDDAIVIGLRVTIDFSLH